MAKAPNKALAWLRVVLSEKGPESSTTRLVLAALFRRIGEEGYCYPSLSRIARDTGLGRRAVAQHIARALEDGWISRHQTLLAPKRHAANRYYPRLPSASPALGGGASPALGSALGTQPSAASAPGVVRDVHPNSPSELSRNSPRKKPAYAVSPDQELRGPLKDRVEGLVSKLKARQRG